MLRPLAPRFYEGLTIETSALQCSYGGKLILLNSFDTKVSVVYYRWVREEKEATHQTSVLVAFYLLGISYNAVLFSN